MSVVSLSRGIRLVVLVFLLAALAAVSARAASADQYAALGDSYSSGVGTGSYTLDSACKRSVYAYPYLVAQKRSNTSLTFVACSGAKTSDLLANQHNATYTAETIAARGLGRRRTAMGYGLGMLGICAALVGVGLYLAVR